MAQATSRRKSAVPIPETIIDQKTGTEYERGKFYGKGAYGRCYAVKESKTQRLFAAKIISLRKAVEDRQKIQMRREISIHDRLRHKNIVAYHGSFEDDNFIYILLEPCQHKSLAELHSRRKVLTESETRYFMKQILEGTQYLHEVGIVHRDLKLANLLLSNDLEVKIADFGLAAKIEFEGQQRMTFCGTPNYVAPEILFKTGHSFEVDIWSIGCIMYTLLAGETPFEATKMEDVFDLIKGCRYAIPPYVSTEATALIERTLQPDPKKRPAAKEILTFEFFKGYIPSALPLTCLTVAPREDTITAHESLASLRQPLLEINYANNVPKKSQAQNVEVELAVQPRHLPDKQPTRKPLLEVNGVRPNSKTSCPAKTSVPPGQAFLKKQPKNRPIEVRESRLEVVSHEIEVRSSPRAGLEVVSRKVEIRSSPRAGEGLKVLLSPKKTTGDSCSNKKPSLTATAIADNCRKYLKSLQKQLDQVMQYVDRNTVPAVQDELTDPAAQPVVWVTKWLVYSEKYGFGYELSDGTFAIVFNDNTRLVLLANHRNIHYIESDGTESYYTMDDTPAHLSKKMKLLGYFRKYMDEEIVCADVDSAISSQETYDLSRSPYIYRWKLYKEDHAVIIQLTNGTFQINFNKDDAIKIIMCPLMRAVTYVDRQNNFRTYKFSTIIRNGCDPTLFKALWYAKAAIGKFNQTSKNL